MMRSLYILLTFLLSAISAIGQITVSGGWNQDSVVIGDEATLTLSIEADAGVEILAVSEVFLDSVYSALASIKAQVDTSQPIIPMIADFELLNLGNWKDAGEDQIFAGDELGWNISQAGGKTLYENTFKFRLWDPGVIIAIYPPVIYADANGQDQFYEGGEMKTFVIPPGGLVSTDSLKIADIKPILQEAVKLSDYMIYFVIIGVALLLGLIYWLLMKYYKADETYLDTIAEPEVILPAHEIAITKLSTLQSKELWQKGEVKTYQSELTYIIREYLENRYNILALESTTDEIVKLIQDQIISDDVTSLKRILQVADLVKFAKATPEDNIHDKFMNEAMGFVQKTKLEERPEQEI